MKRYGIIGGTFNPIHLAHLYIAYEAKIQLGLEKIVFIPAGIPPHKLNDNILSGKIRYDMLKEAIAKYEGFEVSDYEITKSELSYTFETLRHFNSKDKELYFITGADCLLNLEKWKNPSEILSLANLVVFNRGGYDKIELLNKKKYIEKKYNSKIIDLEILDMDISSSMIRERIKENKRVDFFLSAEVISFIEKRRLYKGE